MNKKKKLIALLLGFCLCGNLLFPGLVLAATEQGYIGGENYQGILDEVTIYNSTLPDLPMEQGTIGGNSFQGIIDEVTIYNSALPDLPSEQGNIGGNNFQGVIDEVIIYTGTPTQNRPPGIDLISPSGGWYSFKAESPLSFNIQVIDPNENDQTLITEFYIDNKLVQYFTAKDLKTQEELNLDKGQILATNGHTYAITINKSKYLSGDPNYFELKAKVRDMAGAETSKVVTVKNFNSEPEISISGLSAKQKIPKHESTFSFTVKASDDDQIDQDLQVSFSIIPTNIGGREIPKNERQEIVVNNFTAGGKKITDGKLIINNGKSSTIVIDKSTILSNEVNEFILKAVVSDASHAQGSKEITLIHFNNVPTVKISGLTEGQEIEKTESLLNFELTIEDNDPVDTEFTTEFSIGVFETYYKVSDFYVNEIKPEDKFIAQNGTKYVISLNKGAYVPMYSGEFKLKIEAADTCGEKGVKEITLKHNSDILAHWALDSAKDNLAIDSGGIGNHGIVHGVTSTTGIIGNGYSFDGTNDYVEVPLTPALTMTTSSFSVEAWVKTTDAPTENRGIVTNYRNNTVPFWKLGLEGASKKFHFELRDTNGNYKTISAPTRLNDGQWHHLVGVRDAEQGKIRFYVDGTLAGEGDAPPGDVNSGQSIAFGEHRNQYFQGCLDEVTLYGRALSAEDVREKYEKVVFLDDLTMTNRFDDESTHPCTYGIFMNKLEFELKKNVKDLVIELEVPSSIKIREILSVSKKDAEGNYVSIIPVVGERPIADPSKVSVTENGIISFTQPLDAGSYRIELLLTVDEHLIIKSKAFYDESKIKINNDREIFWFEYMDFKELPNVT